MHPYSTLRPRHLYVIRASCMLFTSISLDVSIRTAVEQRHLSNARCLAGLAALWFIFASTAFATTKKPPLRPININTATSGELQQVPGIGPATAEKILTMRKSYGPFKSVDDLLAIKGLGRKRLDKMRKYLTVGKAAAVNKGAPSPKGNATARAPTKPSATPSSEDPESEDPPGSEQPKEPPAAARLKVAARCEPRAPRATLRAADACARIARSAISTWLR